MKTKDFLHQRNATLFFSIFLSTLPSFLNIVRLLREEDVSVSLIFLLRMTTKMKRFEDNISIIVMNTTFKASSTDYIQ